MEALRAVARANQNELDEARRCHSELILWLEKKYPTAWIEYQGENWKSIFEDDDEE